MAPPSIPDFKPHRGLLANILETVSTLMSANATVVTQPAAKRLLIYLLLESLGARLEKELTEPQVEEERINRIAARYVDFLDRRFPKEPSTSKRLTLSAPAGPGDVRVDDQEAALLPRREVDHCLAWVGFVPWAWRSQVESVAAAIEKTVRDGTVDMTKRVAREFRVEAVLDIVGRLGLSAVNSIRYPTRFRSTIGSNKSTPAHYQPVIDQDCTIAAARPSTFPYSPNPIELDKDIALVPSYPTPAASSPPSAPLNDIAESAHLTRSSAPSPPSARMSGLDLRGADREGKDVCG
ncbi:hypothetical protein LTR16_002561 [Cryomyces antarcticus]|uniref:Uncharacterized protein n=1 Tax=Cryomyces antarcticus TaxID=329879 RepID=A0ABR0LPG3_9PEZI|nr:hypothetical protein LTR60_002452 [Cryomyces antarcticus]KAK5016738.1 hypothetical protein LTR39_001920 [Cryomyces antarcticus]KAK5201467.1 hypothetical protein LTR16_002561 [Cryomyces antarcticus]